jgi:hypothetical protein
MKTETFNSIFMTRIEKMKETILVKAKDYGGVDRLRNFKHASAMMKISPEMVCMAWVFKHIEATLAAVRKIDDEGTLMPVTFWDEKLGDIILYMILLEALVYERMNDEAE